MNVSISLLVAVSTFVLGGCAAVDRIANPIGNPTRIHEVGAADPRADEAARIPVGDYYAALALAHPEEYAMEPPVVPTQDQAAVDNYVAEGIGLVDTYCRRWFRAVEDAQRQQARSQADYNVISQLGTALIGIGRLSSDVTAVYGAANAAVAEFGQNFTEAYLIAPNAENVKTRVFEALASRVSTLTGDGKPTSFKAAYTALEAYADICTYSKARAIADEMVAAPDKVVSVDEAGRVELRGAATKWQADHAPEVEALLARIVALDDADAIALVSRRPSIATGAEADALLAGRDPGNRRATHGGVARLLLQQLVVQTTGDERAVGAWQEALN